MNPADRIFDFDDNVEDFVPSGPCDEAAYEDEQQEMFEH